jgi:hypothetical protein
MVPDRLLIEFGEDDDWVRLRREVRRGPDDEALFELPPAFSREDVRIALLATGQVSERDAELVLAADGNCRSLSRLMGEMFSYFDSSEQPSAQLREVQAAVSEYGLTPATCPAMPLWALAWLDLVVREDLADDARSREGIWSDPDFVVHVEPHCRRRVDELLRRYNQPVVEVPIGRMASSSRTRVSSVPGRSETG